MPPRPGPRPAKKDGAKSVKAAPSKKKKNHSRSAEKDNKNATAGSTTTGERNPKNVPAPAAVLMHALGLPLTPQAGNVDHSINNNKSDKDNRDGDEKKVGSMDVDASRTAPPAQTSGPSPFIANMEVEVETKQGYLYSGKLAVMDAHYNVVLHESLVRRARGFDFARAAQAQQQQRDARLIANSLRGSLFYDAPGEREGLTAGEGHLGASLMDGLPRARYIGTVSLRSNNVVLMRFAPPTTTTVASTPAAASADAPWARLQKSFVNMAAAIKAHLQREKMRRRAARRQRLEAKKA